MSRLTEVLNDMSESIGFEVEAFSVVMPLESCEGIRGELEQAQNALQEIKENVDAALLVSETADGVFVEARQKVASAGVDFDWIEVETQRRLASKGEDK